MFSNSRRTTAFFYRVTARPKTMLVTAMVIIAMTATGLGRIVKDTSVKAFIPDDHPALVADELAAEIFGLSDTIAIAVTTSGETVFTPDVLLTVAELTEQVSTLPNIRQDRVMSLATESSISGSDGRIDVTPYVGSGPMDQNEADDSRRRWQAMPAHIGTLVSEDESSAIVLAEIIDPDLADVAYTAILEAVDAAQFGDLDIKVAGPGAVSGYLGRYIDEDARKLQPLVFALVLGFIYFAFRRFKALPGPLLVVLGAAGGALGLMAWNGVPYYAITNALPVIVVAISVADAIHVLSAYFQYRSQQPKATARDLVVSAMSTMSRPITLTTITTIAGFAGIAVASVMPPITEFAKYAALGVFLAWMFSIFALPNMLVLLRPGPSPAFENWSRNTPSGIGRFLAHVGAVSAAHYRLVLAGFAAATLVAGYGAAELRVDRSQIDNFAQTEPIRIADEHINRTFEGTAFLDVLIETPVDEGLLEPARMQRIADLQAFVEQLPHVQKSFAITDYLSLLHHALEDRTVDTGAPRRLPDADDSIAQYLLLYEMSGDPTDFEEEIDYDYRTALLRVILNNHYFSETRATVEALQRYVDAEFNDDTLTATLAGDVTVGYHWMSRLERSHFVGVGLSLVLVLVTSMLVFRSPSAGIIAVVPVSFAVLILYAVMGYSGIYLEPATSMFAAIALGVGVDFGIHLVERLKQAQAVHADNTAAAVDSALPPTARACFFNSTALALGFSVLMVSNLPTLQRFGGLVTVAAVSSYLAALVIVPALYAAENAIWQRLGTPNRSLAARSLLIVAMLAGSMFLVSQSRAADVSAEQIARNVSERAEGTATRREIDITLTNKRGRTRKRAAMILKLNTDSVRYTRITYTEPKAIRATTFLSHDFHDTRKSDSGWFYLPSARKVRRVPASDRGDYFLGTDFTYEDIQSELKFDLDDYKFAYVELASYGDRRQHKISGHPKSDAIARQLGYGGFDAIVDEATWMPMQVDFYDLSGSPLKTVYVTAVHEIENIWTATQISAVNHQTGHKTEFRFTDVDYMDALEQQLFQAQSLTRGLPASITGGAR